MTFIPDKLAEKVAVCVVSFDGSCDLWPPFFDTLDAAWPDCSLPLYLVSNFKTYDGPHDVRTLAIGEDRDWSSNILKALEGIKERHVLFIFDDFMMRSIDVERLTYYLGRAVQNDWPYLTLHPNNYMKERIEPGIRRISEHGVYRCTLVYGIFRKDALSTLLKPGENAWEFEIESGVRARGMPLYSVDRKIFRHYHLLRKGVWMRPGYPKFATRYALNASRPVESFAGYIQREFKEWLFRKYHRVMPGQLIERRETRRVRQQEHNCCRTTMVPPRCQE